MPRRCIIPSCQALPSDNLFKFPSDNVTRAKWIEFVKSHGVGEDTITVSSRLCHKHFQPECFPNFHRRQMGFTTRPLAVASTAEPTVSVPGLRCSPGPPASGASTALLVNDTRTFILPSSSCPVMPTTLMPVIHVGIPQFHSPIVQPILTSQHPAEMKVETVDRPNLGSLHPAKTKVETVDNPILQPNLGTVRPAETKVETVDQPILQAKVEPLHPAETKVQAVDPVDVFRSVKHVGCQTEENVLLRRKTVGTQLSVRTLIKHKDKGSQVRVPCRDLGVGTTTVPLDRLQIFIQPTVTETSPKRRRVSLKQEDCG